MAFSKSTYLQNMSSLLNQQRSREFLCDFVVRVGDHTFPVHRNVLAARSRYFEAMFRHNMKEVQEGSVEMKDIERDAMKQCIDFMYMGQLTVSMENCRDLLHTSNFLMVQEMSEVCFAYLEANLTPHNSLYIEKTARMFDNAILSHKAEIFTLENLTHIVSSPEFANLEKSQIVLYIKSMKSIKNKRALWQAVTKWINHAPNDREQDFPELLGHLLFEGLPLATCITDIWNEPLLKRFKNCKDHIVTRLLADVKASKDCISVDNCFTLDNLATAYEHYENAGEVKTDVRSYMSINSSALQVREEFKYAELDCAVLILSSLDVTSFDSATRQWNAAMKWVKHDVENRKASLKPIMECIDLSSYPEEFIIDVVRSEPLVADSSDCKDLLLGVLCHISCKRRRIGTSSTVSAGELKEVGSGFTIPSTTFGSRPTSKLPTPTFGYTSRKHAKLF